jgi:hypothetical protein
MFLNVRLLIVAVFASVMGISCALALFAEFRVSSDSFLQASSGNAPLQFGSDQAASAAVIPVAATFGSRFQTGAAPSAVIAAAQTPATSGHDAGVDAAGAAPAVPPAPALATPVVAMSVPEPAPLVAPPSAPATPIIPASVIPASVPQPAPLVAPATAPATPGSAAGAPNPAATDAVAGSTAQQNAKKDPTGDIAARTPAASLPVEKAVPEGKIAPQSAKSPEPPRAAKTAPRRRATEVRHIRRSRRVAPTPAQSAGPSSADAQPAFQWTPQPSLQPPPAVRRRVIVRRRRPVKKTAGKRPAPQATATRSAVASTAPR